jgi:hypothetical protein
LGFPTFPFFRLVISTTSLCFYITTSLFLCQQFFLIFFIFFIIFLRGRHETVFC